MTKKKEVSPLRAFADKYNLDNSLFWQHKQSGSWILKHNGVVQAAAQENIKFDLTIPDFGDGAVRKVVIVTATMEGRHPVSMIGECKVGRGITDEYPWSMCCKRAEDRAVLRLLFPGGDLYSSTETFATDSSPSPTPQKQKSRGLSDIKKKAKAKEKTNEPKA